jgi:hypothetical protein
MNRASASALSDRHKQCEQSEKKIEISVDILYSYSFFINLMMLSVAKMM